MIKINFLVKRLLIKNHKGLLKIILGQVSENCTLSSSNLLYFFIFVSRSSTKWFLSWPINFHFFIFCFCILLLFFEEFYVGQKILEIGITHQIMVGSIVIFIFKYNCASWEVFFEEFFIHAGEAYGELYYFLVWNLFILTLKDKNKIITGKLPNLILKSLRKFSVWFLYFGFEGSISWTNIPRY